MSLPQPEVDWHCNTIPATVRHVHLLAVCGTAMGALACLLKEAGYAVSGSDHNVYPPMSDFLREKGIALRQGFDAANLQPAPDLVVVGNAISRGNPEAEAMLSQGLPFCSMPQAINHFVVGSRQRLMVCGTHGKTTTAALLTWFLETAGRQPGFIIGGLLNNYNSNFRMGAGGQVVLEGDEYDTAFFDKGPKFLHYPADITLLTGIEFDHADIYADVAAVEAAFASLLALLPATSQLLVNAHDPRIPRLLPNCAARIATYGHHSEAVWRVGEVDCQPPRTFFTVYHQNAIFGRFETRLMGHHNLLNILAAMAAAQTLNVSPQEMAQALKTFTGIKRRQEIRGQVRGITVLDDFAHHPTAVAATITAVKPFYPDGRLIAVFEPRTNTSLRNTFQAEYAASFEQADLIAIAEPTLLHKVPEDMRFSAAQLVADLRRRGQTAHLFPSVADIITFITHEARSGDVVLIMSNGGFDRIHQRLLDALGG